MFPERLKALRIEHKLTHQKVADYLGITRQGYAKYENGQSQPDIETINKLARLFGVSTDYLLGRSNDPRPIEDVFPPIEQIIERQGYHLVPIPILGRIHAGEPMYAEQNIIGWTAIPEHMARGGNYFALEVVGDCMAGGRKPIEEGDLVIIREQPDVENGQVAAVLWPEVSEAQLRRVYKRNGEVILRADNPAYPPEIVRKANLRIIGLVVSVISAPAAAKDF